MIVETRRDFSIPVPDTLHEAVESHITAALQAIKTIDEKFVVNPTVLARQGVGETLRHELGDLPVITGVVMEVIVL